MSITDKPYRFYLLFTSFFTLGWIWITYNLISSPHKTISVCLFKNVTGLPCPSCGSTKSVTSILSGNWSDGLQYNPIGYILLLTMMVMPVWLLYDLISKRTSLLNNYLNIELKIKKKPIIAIFGILLIALTWIWNLQTQ